MEELNSTKIESSIHNQESQTVIIDLIKVFCCVLIVGSHCLPLFSNSLFNYYYGQWFFRFCVPLFFVSSGFFFEKMRLNKRLKYIARIAILYFISTLLYLPLIIKQNTSLAGIIKDIVFGYHHLWYLSALTIGLLLFCALDRIFNRKKYIFILLILVGILFDEYYKIFQSDILYQTSNILNIIGGSRHAIWFTLPLLLIGGGIYLNKDKLLLIKKRVFALLLSLFFVASLIEAVFLKRFVGDDATLDVTFFGWLPSVPLFCLGVSTYCSLSYSTSRKIRKIIDLVYVIHVLIIVALSKFFGLGQWILFITSLTFSFIVSFFVVFIFDYFATKRKEKPY